MKGEGRNRFYFPVDGSAAIMAIWGLRIMVTLDGHVDATRSHGNVVDLEDFEWRGLGLKTFRQGLSPRKFRALAKQRLVSLESNNQAFDQPFGDNMTMLSGCLGLSATERKILEFALHAHNSKFLNRICDHLPGDMTGSDNMDRTLAFILDMEAHRSRSALASNSRLIQSGLLNIERRSNWDFVDRFDLMKGLIVTMFECHEDAYSLLKPFCPPAKAPGITLDDFPHLAGQLESVFVYLKNGLAQGKRGVNILFYGPPGTGKTELALNLAQACDASCYEVAMSDEEGSSLSGNDRFDSYRLAQSVLSNGTNNLVIFDEVEDVFGSAERGSLRIVVGNRGGPRSKAWVNQVLENNPVPTIWITNKIWNLDHAYLRRFDFVIEVNVPPRKVRRRILQEQITSVLDDPVSERWIEKVVEHDHVSPAMITSATKTLSDIGVTEPDQAERHMTAMFDNWCKAMGLPRIGRVSVPDLISYRPDLLNTDPSLDRLITGLEKTGMGRLCLYGPPGTGKTAFGRHIARTLDKPLIVKRASELLSMWVGQSEKNIARMFEEAEQDEAVLLLDEADSFLRDRRSARASWEVTQVNELLTQMESFMGIFICSTNLMDSFDEASLRRFDLKVRFDTLTPEQRWELFKQILQDGGSQTPESQDVLQSLKPRVQEQLEGITPGDFAMVLRKIKLIDRDLDADSLYDELRSEVRIKQARSGREIGFSACI